MINQKLLILWGKLFCQWHRQMKLQQQPEQPDHAHAQRLAWNFGADLISKTPPLLLGRLDICSLGVGIAFKARLRGGTPHSALCHTHCDLRERQNGEEEGVGRVGRRCRKVEEERGDKMQMIQKTSYTEQEETEKWRGHVEENRQRYTRSEWWWKMKMRRGKKKKQSGGGKKWIITHKLRFHPNVKLILGELLKQQK